MSDTRMSDTIEREERTGAASGPADEAETDASTGAAARDEAATSAFAERIVEARGGAGAGLHEGWRRAVRLLGAHVRDDDLAEIAVWTPSLVERGVPAGDVFVEVLEPIDALDLTVSRSTVRFQRTLVPTTRVDDIACAAVRGMRAGTRDEIGTFYAFVWRDREGEEHRLLDPMAASLPFGAFAPAELYDVGAM